MFFLLIKIIWFQKYKKKRMLMLLLCTTELKFYLQTSQVSYRNDVRTV